MVEIQEDGCGSGCGLFGEKVAGLRLLLVIVVVYLERKVVISFRRFQCHGKI